MKKILLAYDGSPAADRALNTTTELARLTSSSVTVLGVVPPVHFPELFPLLDEGTDDLAMALERAREALAARGIDASVEECAGDPADTIERLADDEGFDLIVVGSHDRHALGRFLGGSVSAHVAAHAHETVVVAR